MSLNTTPITWVSGSVVTAAQMNSEIRDAVTGIQAAWTAYTPTTTGITLGNGTVAGRFNRVGKTVDFQATFTFGSTSSITAGITITMPVTALNTAVNGSGTVFDSSASAYYAVVPIATSTTVITPRLWTTTAGGNLGTVTSTTPMTWATGDVLTIAGRYEAA